MNEALPILERARELCAHGWTRGDAYARDAGDRKVDWRTPEAALFCAYGAIQRAAWEQSPTSEREWTLETRAKMRLFDYLSERGELRTTGGSVISWEDAPGRSAAQVLALFDAVIGRLREVL